MTELTLGVLVAAFGVYGASATAKLRGRRAYRAFRTELRGTDLVPPRSLASIAAILVTAEAVTAVALGAGAVLMATARAGAVTVSAAALGAAAALTATLAAGVAVLIRRHTRARCACFGAASARPIGVSHLVRNTCLLVLMAVGLAALLAGSTGHGSPGATAAAAGGGVLMAVLLVRFDDMVEVFLPVQPGGGR